MNFAKYCCYYTALKAFQQTIQIGPMYTQTRHYIYWDDVLGGFSLFVEICKGAVLGYISGTQFNIDYIEYFKLFETSSCS